MQHRHLQPEPNSVLLGGGEPESRRAGLRLRTLAAPVVMLAALGTAAPAVAAEVPSSLLDAAKAHPEKSFDVIVQAPSADAAAAADAAVLQSRPGQGAGLGTKHRFHSVGAVSARLSGAQITLLASNPGLTSITPDSIVVATGKSPFSNGDRWPVVTQTTSVWPSVLSMPTIAVIDSGVEPGRSDFGTRVLKSVVFSTSGTVNSPGDGYGHGTFVAGIAAGAGLNHAGGAPTAPIVSLDVIDDKGMATVSDVIAACDWIVQNKAAYNIRVANLSLAAASPSTIMNDPLDRAVENLWLNGVVVVAAAGNQGSPSGPSGEPYAPANDPFVITVGASDTMNSNWTGDDVGAPWTGWGYTQDGFAKPDLAAPGRVLTGPVPATSTMLTSHPERQVAPGYMWMSGTSFAAPIVSSAAAWVLAFHPGWTPDDVKGALMVSAAPGAVQGAPSPLGVGTVQVQTASQVVTPPNPNAGLDTFVVTTNKGGRSFDAAAWSSSAKANAAWNSAAWNSAAWSTAAWSTAAWSTAAWSTAAWSTASASTASSTAAWNTAAWNTAAWGSSTWVQ